VQHIGVGEQDPVLWSTVKQIHGSSRRRRWGWNGGVEAAVGKLDPVWWSRMKQIWTCEMEKGISALVPVGWMGAKRLR
jgi:hypothetical protein